MSQKVFDESKNYVDEFVKEYSKQYDFIDYKYYDARVHPKYSDHVIVVSKNVFPKEAGLKFYNHRNDFYDIQSLYNYDTQMFDELCTHKKKIIEEDKEEVQLGDYDNSENNSEGSRS